MPRHRRCDDISPYHLHKIERQVGLLAIDIREAQATLTPFRTHYDALMTLQGHIREALNLLNGRAADHAGPDGGAMSGLLKQPQSQGEP